MRRELQTSVVRAGIRSGSIALLLSLLAFILPSCDENLPPYDEPDAKLASNIWGEYHLVQDEHSLRVYVQITNLYEETLSAKSPLKGAVVLFFPRDTSVHKTLPLSSANLVTENVFANGILTINPKQSILFKAVWTFPGDSVIDDLGRDLRGTESKPGFFSFVSDQSCNLRVFAKPEDVILQASISLFAQRAPVQTAQTPYRFCFISTFVPATLCPLISTVTPCSNWH